MGNFCHLQLVCYDMPITCQNPSSRTVHKLSTIKIDQRMFLFLACWVWIWCKRADVWVKDGFGVCFVLVAQISKQLMLLFKSPHKAKTTFNHIMLKNVLDQSFCVIIEYIRFAVHIIVLADIHTICKQMHKIGSHNGIGLQLQIYGK